MSEHARYEGDYLEASQLMAIKSGIEVVIDSVIPGGTEKDARGKVIKEKILVLRGKVSTKKFVLNTSNHRMLSSQFGDDKNWPGKTIKIAARYLKEAFGQKNCPCVRVMPEKGKPVPMSVLAFLGRPEPTWD